MKYSVISLRLRREHHIPNRTAFICRYKQNIFREADTKNISREGNVNFSWDVYI